MLGAETLAKPDQFHLPTLYVDPISPILMLLKVTLVVGSLASILRKFNVSDSYQYSTTKEDSQSRVSLGSIARTSITAIQPVHESTRVVPDRHGKHHATTNCLTHLCESTTLLEG